MKSIIVWECYTDLIYNNDNTPISKVTAWQNPCNNPQNKEIKPVYILFMNSVHPPPFTRSNIYYMMNE